MHKYGAFSGLYFLVFGLNTEIYSATLLIEPEPNMGKYRPEKNPYLDTFYTVYSEKRVVADTAAAVEVAVTLTGF